MYKQISILIILSLLTSCIKKSTFDNNEKFEKFGTPLKVEYYKHIEGKAFQWSDTASFVISDTNELKTVTKEIKNADNPEPWKGAGWDRIKIYYKDTILILNTDSKKIGESASGTFYDLDKDNFITKRIDKK